MKLRLSTTSPYARKCLLVAREAGLIDQITLVWTTPWAKETDLPQDNPLGKVPVLILDNGEVLFDSPVICEYLDSLHSGPKLIPPAGPERWSALRLAALADGIVDAGAALKAELGLRPVETRWPAWSDRQMDKVRRGLDAMEREVADWGDAFRIGQIGAISALGFLTFRQILDWRAGYPGLARWADQVASRPSVAATEPYE
jgi:glutathione S-transferase